MPGATAGVDMPYSAASWPDANMIAPGPLLALAEDLLGAARVVAPALSTLERLVGSVAAHAVQDLFERIAAGLPERLRDAIEDLVDVPEGEHRSSLAHLKEPPPVARAVTISARLARLDRWRCGFPGSWEWI